MSNAKDHLPDSRDLEGVNRSRKYLRVATKWTSVVLAFALDRRRDSNAMKS